MVTVVVVMHLEKSLNKGLCIIFITEILVYCMVFIIISSKNRWIFFPFLLHGVFCIASQVLCCNRGFFFLYDRYTSIVLFMHWGLSLLIFFFWCLWNWQTMNYGLFSTNLYNQTFLWPDLRDWISDESDEDRTQITRVLM